MDFWFSSNYWVQTSSVFVGFSKIFQSFEGPTKGSILLQGLVMITVAFHGHGLGLRSLRVQYQCLYALFPLWIHGSPPFAPVEKLYV